MSDVEAQRERWRIAKLVQRAKKKIEEGDEDRLTPLEFKTALDHDLISVDLSIPNTLYSLTDLEKDFPKEDENVEKKETVSIRPLPQTQKEKPKEKYIPKSREQRIIEEIEALKHKALLGPQYFNEIDEIRLSDLKERLAELTYRSGRAFHLWRKQ